MLEILRELCTLDAVSGDEAAVRDYIINKIKNHCEYKIDPLGSIIAFKKGKKTPAKKVMLDAHMDEVGLIITYITDDGFLKFSAVGGIDTSVLMFRRVKVNGINGVISGKPIHLISADERKKLPDPHSLYIDIGASSKEDALKLVSPGDRAVICGEYTDAGDKIKSKALDDRIGCAVLISMLLKEAEYDFYAVFSVQEEVGLRGAKAAAYSIAPEYALAVDVTDTGDTPECEKMAVKLGGGAAVKVMDRSIICDPDVRSTLIELAKRGKIPYQLEVMCDGGTDAGAIHISRGGVKTGGVSIPTRYIHSPSEAASLRDIDACIDLLCAFCENEF